MIALMEPVRSDEDDFHEWLADILGRYGKSFSAVRAELLQSTRFPRATSVDQLASISSGRRRANPQAVVEIADALAVLTERPEVRDEFPDYDLCLLRSLLDPKIVGAEEAMRLAADLGDHPAISRGAAIERRLRDAVRSSKERREGSDASAPPRRRRGR